jgi:hypothetical protein
MPKIIVEEVVNVIARPGLHVVYQPGERLAPDAHIDDIERQGKGKRLTNRGDAFAEPPADAGAAS